MTLPRIIIAGTNSGAGKTTLTLALLAALSRSGVNVQPFKTGPDYIDPMHHARAAGRVSYNLDSWMLSRDAVLELFSKHARDAEISVIEGVMGLYDGLRDSGEGSTAHLAKLLNVPVILVINARAMATSAAAIALGFKEFDRDVNLAGIMLNNVGSESHYKYVKSAIEKNTAIPVIGHLPRDSEIKLPERHLGLLPVLESGANDQLYEKLVAHINKNIDLKKLREIAERAGALPEHKTSVFAGDRAGKKVRIAVARDKAFNFYYQDNLEILEHYGAELVEFSPIADESLPSGVDGIYIGGGFPEIFARELSENTRLKCEIRDRAKAGMPLYAECGGLMYLMDELLDFNGASFGMVGIFNGAARMTKKLQTFGYVTAEAAAGNILSNKGDTIRAHIFHYSTLDGAERGTAYRLSKNSGKVIQDGLQKWNTLAGYTHFHFAANIDFARNFIKNCEIHGGAYDRQIEQIM